MMDYQLSGHETRVVVSTEGVSTAAHQTQLRGGEGSSSEKYNRLPPDLPSFVRETK